jgi:hypothetical protein
MADMVVRNWATRALTCNKEEVTTAVSVVKGTGRFNLAQAALIG